MQERRAFAETGHAMRLLEGVAAAVARAEPVLLVGETGTGKTAIVQHLAEQVPIQHGLCNAGQTQHPRQCSHALCCRWPCCWTAVLYHRDSSAGHGVLQ